MSRAGGLLLLSLCLVGGPFGPGFAASAADEPSAAPAAPAKPATDRLAPPEEVKPVVPSKSELADSAFKKLDPTGKGYVTAQDTRGLDGFDAVFRSADTDHSGKLDLEQFKKAWAEYTGYHDRQ